LKHEEDGQEEQQEAREGRDEEARQEEEEVRQCFVFFTLYKRRRITLRAIRRCRGLAYRSIIIWIVAKLGRCDMVHICIGDGCAVLDATIEGPRFFESTAFSLKFPRLAWCILVPTKSRIRLEIAENRGPISVIRTFIRHFTGGRTESNDCVSLASEILNDAGVHVPRNIVTPGQLWDHLRARGHELIEMS
jgi:hypothetical protein